jgi:hypothetical protein
MTIEPNPINPEDIPSVAGVITHQALSHVAWHNNQITNPYFQYLLL